jgi:SRSO17 transposase
MDLDRLQDYLDQFRSAFRRKDQARWAAVYCQGLLLDVPRKNVETLARHVVLPAGLGVEDVTQALHNFLSHSPWDERVLARRCRERLAHRLGQPDGVFLLDEITFPKQGAHSVGVLRQYSGDLREKLNCQVAVAVHYAGAAGACLLALRLYLPGPWLASPVRLNAAGVPLECRRRVGKAQLGLELLAEVRAEGFPGQHVAAARDAGVHAEALAGQIELPAALTRLAGPRLGAAREAVQQLRRQLSQLGLEHFEGRSWRGLHHHTCLVAVAHAFRRELEAGGETGL